MKRAIALLLAALAAVTLAGLAGGAAAVARLRINPPMASRGAPITITGTGFKPSLKVSLHIGRPRTDNTARIGGVTANGKGGFRFVKTLSSSIGAGKWIIVACQQSCRVKATRAFYVSKVKPL